MKPQCKSVLNYIKKHRTITSREAFFVLSVSRLAARIADLRDAGYRIKTRLIRVPTAWGSARIAEYRL